MIAPELLAQVIAKVDAIGLDEAAIVALRKDWPGVHFTYCSDDDVPARLKPEATGAGYSVYLVSGAEHCVAFTEHLEAATGLVLATQSDED